MIEVQLLGLYGVLKSVNSAQFLGRTDKRSDTRDEAVWLSSGLEGCRDSGFLVNAGMGRCPPSLSPLLRDPARLSPSMTSRTLHLGESNFEVRAVVKVGRPFSSAEDRHDSSTSISSRRFTKASILPSRPGGTDQAVYQWPSPRAARSSLRSEVNGARTMFDHARRIRSWLVNTMPFHSSTRR